MLEMLESKLKDVMSQLDVLTAKHNYLSGAKDLAQNAIDEFKKSAISEAGEVVKAMAAVEAPEAAPLIDAVVDSME